MWNIKLPVHIIFHTWHSLYWKFHFISCLHWQNPRPSPPTAWRRSGTTQVFPWWCHLLLKNLSHHGCHGEWGFRLCFPLEISGTIFEMQFLSKCNLQINLRANRFKRERGSWHKIFSLTAKKIMFWLFYLPEASCKPCWCQPERGYFETSILTQKKENSENTITYFPTVCTVPTARLVFILPSVVRKYLGIFLLRGAFWDKYWPEL